MSTEEHDQGVIELREETRYLEPISKFSSFILWNPDILVPVDENRDEYLQALSHGKLFVQR
jgi:hypothetical protein